MAGRFLYICDPEKNKDCAKTICYCHANSNDCVCMHTDNILCAKHTPEDLLPFIYDKEGEDFWEGVVGRGKTSLEQMDFLDRWKR